MAEFKSRSIRPSDFQTLYDQGKDDVQIGRELGVGTSSVRRLRHHLGLPFQKHARKPPNPRTTHRRVDYEDLRRMLDDGLLKTDDDIANHYGLKKKAAAKRRARAGVIRSPAPTPRTTPEKLALGLSLLQEGMSYRAATEVADLPENRLADEFPGYGWTPQHSGQMRQAQVQAEKAIRHSWPAYADKYQEVYQ